MGGWMPFPNQSGLEVTSGSKECVLPFDKKVFLPSLRHARDWWGKGLPVPKPRIQGVGRQEEGKSITCLGSLLSVWEELLFFSQEFDDFDGFSIYPIGVYVDPRTCKQSLLHLPFLSFLSYGQIVPSDLEKWEKLYILSPSSGSQVCVFTAVVFLDEDLSYANRKRCYVMKTYQKETGYNMLKTEPLWMSRSH